MTYLDLPEDSKRIWRKKMRRQLSALWIQAIEEEHWQWGFIDYLEAYLEIQEADQNFEICAGLKDLIDEERAKLAE